MYVFSKLDYSSLSVHCELSIFVIKLSLPLPRESLPCFLFVLRTSYFLVIFSTRSIHTAIALFYPNIYINLHRSTHTAIRSLNDPFELCRYKCRTSSGSVVHENSYRSPAWKYCYGLERPPLQPGISMNSDLSFAIEMEKGKSAMVENPSQRLDP